MGDEAGSEIDFRVIVIDGHANGLYGDTEKGEMYPAALLTGTGSMNGRAYGKIRHRKAVDNCVRAAGVG